MKKDAFGVVSKHRSKIRLVLRELGSNSTSAGYTQAKRRSKVSKYVVKEGGGYVVMSEKGKRLSKPSSKAQAVKRLRQIEYFKHQGA